MRRNIQMKLIICISFILLAVMVKAEEGELRNLDSGSTNDQFLRDLQDGDSCGTCQSIWCDLSYPPGGPSWGCYCNYNTNICFCQYYCPLHK